jgi:hypothetical protein
VRIRYARGGAQSVGAALATGGFMGTGASDLGDMKDELRELKSTPGKLNRRCCLALVLLW